MTYVVEGNLFDFQAWSGGKDWLDEMKKRKLVEEVQAYIEERYEENVSETTINDFLWFDAPTIWKKALQEEDIEKMNLEQTLENFEENRLYLLAFKNGDRECMRFDSDTELMKEVNLIFRACGTELDFIADVETD